MSIAGGTDLIGCFMGGNPNLPVYSGELQCKASAWTPELLILRGIQFLRKKENSSVVRRFPPMPIKFWNDPGDAKYKKPISNASRESGPMVISLKSLEGGVIIYGRSDTVLNPGGVRIGTGEIYRPVEEMEEVVDSLVVGQPGRVMSVWCCLWFSTKTLN